MALFEGLMDLTKGATQVLEGSKDAQRDAGKTRRKSREICDELGEIYTQVSDMAEAASVWKTLGGFRRNRRNSRENLMTDDMLHLAFNRIDKDGSGKISKAELEEALSGEESTASLKGDQISALLNFADADGDGEIDFEEYKIIMGMQAGTKEAAKQTGS